MCTEDGWLDISADVSLAEFPQTAIWIYKNVKGNIISYKASHENKTCKSNLLFALVHTNETRLLLFLLLHLKPQMKAAVWKQLYRSHCWPTFLINLLKNTQPWVTWICASDCVSVSVSGSCSCSALSFAAKATKRRHGVTCQFITADCAPLQGIKMISSSLGTRVLWLAKQHFVNQMQILRVQSRHNRACCR